MPTPTSLKSWTAPSLSSKAEVFWKPRMIAVRPSSLALRMSAVVRALTIRSSCSRNQPFQRATLAMVSAKPSHTQQVQLAAVSPPLRMSRNTSSDQLETMSPSMTIRSSCSVLKSWSSSDAPRLSGAFPPDLSLPARKPVVSPG